MASNTSLRSKSEKMLTEGLAVVPSSLTDVATTDSILFQVVVVNGTATARTYLLQDKQASPLVLLSITVAANSTEVVPFPEGVKMLKGFSHQAGAASALNVEYFGFQI